MCWTCFFLSEGGWAGQSRDRSPPLGRYVETRPKEVVQPGRNVAVDHRESDGSLTSTRCGSPQASSRLHLPTIPPFLSAVVDRSPNLSHAVVHVSCSLWVWGGFLWAGVVSTCSG